MGEGTPEVADGAIAANADHVARSAAQLADTLADARLAVGISGRAAATAAGIGRNTRLRLERDPLASRVDLIIRLGLVAGVRLELRPLHTSDDVTRRAAPPLPDGAAFAGAASASALGAHLARLLGAELRWTRRAARRTAVDVARDAGLGSDRTVRRLEHGEPTMLAHALAVALCLGHRLAWEPAKSPWRQRPWQLPQPSPSRRGRRSVHPMFSSAFSGWTSPPELVTSLETLFGPWGLDVAATASTSVARSWLGPGHPVWARRDALSDEWPDWSRLADDGDAALWMNPPHADVSPWLRRAAATAEAGRTVVGLLPVRTSSAEWHEVILPRAEVVVLARRLRYGHPSGTGGSAPFSSAVVVWPGPRPSRAAARHLLTAWAADGWGTLMHAPPT